ncbi:Aste57867_20542 [Aphanomyces stellatus]|uniref:Aste57867_20542 protein n=1 Tax=Aphanomyces stellatus TaxID=120398 RepID=A0A485LFX2_9STRA|nr:hypothetical protein As57867_020475 [Aphanomyces stellatus]VFT97227.1 Aste57867_20542 [Aphanomyces stellatus]
MAASGSLRHEKVLKRRQGEKLGLSLISLNQNVIGSIFVSHVIENSAATRQNIEAGWELLAVNGQKVEFLSVDDVVKLAGASNEVRMTFEALQASRFVKWKKETSRNIAPASHPAALPHKDTQKAKPVAKKAVPAKDAKPSKRPTPTPIKDTPSHEPINTPPPPPSKKKKATPTHNSIHQYLQSSAGNHAARAASPSGQPAVHHPLVELSRAEKSKKSMIVDKLTFMGFSKKDALLSCDKCGFENIDANMVWLVSHIEERQFQDELNKAQIESELQKRSEDTQHKQKEQEVLQTTSSLRSLFPESVTFDPVSCAPRVVALIDTTLVDVDAASPLRQLVVDILTLEAKARKWYKRPAECYVIKLVQRVNALLDGSHKFTAGCCGFDPAVSKSTCPLVQLLRDEIAAFKKHLRELSF